MAEPLRLSEKYVLAGCCNPRRDDPIVGYFSYDDRIKVHRADCPKLATTDRSRLVSLDWGDILETVASAPSAPEVSLSEIEIAVLRHHRTLGVDYSLKVARDLNLEREAVFECHRRLRADGLLERVEPTMIQYRKGVVPNKWIKHRNHTYYRLTELGAALLKAAEARRGTPDRNGS